MVLDSKWLDILKASGWQTTGIAAAAAFLIYANAKKLFPTPLEPWVIEAAVVVLVVSICLALASLGSVAVRASQGPRAKLAHLWAIRRAKHQIVKDIPYMTPKERDIVGYLLAKNQRMFTNTADGGYANTLISKRIVVCALLPGQACTDFEVPFKVPNHAWDVLMKHKAEFPYAPPKPGEAETHPWRVHWMLR